MRTCARVLLSAALLVHQQGFLISEAFAAQIAAPKAGVSVSGSALTGSAGAVQLGGPAASLALPGASLNLPAVHTPILSAQTLPTLGPAQSGAGSFSPNNFSAAPSAAVSVSPAGTNGPAAVTARAGGSASVAPSAGAVGGAGPVALRGNAAANASDLAPAPRRADADTSKAGLAKTLTALGAKLLGRSAPAAASAATLDTHFDGTTARAAGAAKPSAAAAPSVLGSAVSASPRGKLRSASSLQPAGDADFQTAAAALTHAELKALLGDGTISEKGRIGAFIFRSNGGQTYARSAGLEGFLFRKLELEARHGFAPFAHHVPHYFAYLDELLAPVAGAAGLRAELKALSVSEILPEALNDALNAKLQSIVAALRKQAEALEKNAWGRASHTYVILARGYNRMREGKNFFDSLDDAELERIRAATQADELWLVDIFEIGNIRRWGTGGGSPYAIKGYKHIKQELGGMKGYLDFVKRAKAKGFRVRTDLIPNHTSLDSELMERYPQAFIHILPPQNLSDEEIMTGVPRENNQWRSPFFYLVKSMNYPGRVGQETKVLIHHPRTDYGDTMWIDMGQIDYSVPEARKWMLEQVSFLFGKGGLSSVRRDMAYYVLNEGYYQRWLHILGEEVKLSSGWAREEMEEMLAGFKERWAILKGSEILSEISSAARAANPEAVLHDEAYAYFTGLSAAGSDGVYGKNTHDAAMGQVGLYDAMRERDAAAVREALRNNAFRFWQRGGATVVNFIGNHDEMNPVDRFGDVFRAAAATALLGGAILTYNGQELGTNQAEMLGALPNSVDKGKAIPFDVPVAIDWTKNRPENAWFLKMLWAKRLEYAGLFKDGAMDALEPLADTAVAAYSVGARGSAKSLVVASNFGKEWSWGRFRMSAPVLSGFGAFTPKAGKVYLFSDQAHKGKDGQPVTYAYTGRQLLEEGLSVHLAPGDAHIFEVTELSPESAAQIQGRQAASPLAAALARALSEGASAQISEAPAEAGRFAKWLSAPWSVWVDRLVYFAIVPFLFLQMPQIVQNFANLTADPAKISILPWIGYSAGIVANLTLLTYFTSIGKKAVAWVQGVGVVTSAVVLGQIFAAGYMPMAAMAVMPVIVAAGLSVNILKWMNKLPATVFGVDPWKAWNDATVLLGLFALPMGFSVTFNLMNTYPWAVLGVSAALALAGLRLMALDRRGKLPAWLHSIWQTLGAWLATALFVFLPIPQIVNNVAAPENIAGIALGTLVLSVAGNLLEATGAIYHKNRIWFTGSFWAVGVGGWGVLLSMFAFGAVSPALFWGFSIAVPLLLLASAKLSARSHGQSIKEALSFLWRTPPPKS